MQMPRVVPTSRPLRRVAISQRFLPHYRIAFFDRLSRKLADRGVMLRLFYSYTMGEGTPDHAWARRIPAVRKDVQIGELAESAVLAPGLFRELVRFAPDAVILEDLAGLPNSLLGTLYCRIWKRPYLVWGLGQVPEKERSRLRTLLAPAISVLYRSAAGFLCYSSHAAGVYAQYNKPTYVAPNSYLARPSDADVARWMRVIEQRYGRDEIRVVSIGTLKRQKRYDALVTAMAETPRHVKLHLVGDGPETASLQQLTERLGIADRVVFHGAMYDDAAKATVLSTAHIGVIPGRGGLAIQEMMAYGVPVICGVADGTERDLIRDGENGYLLAGFPTAKQIASALQTFLRRSADSQQAMARGALETVVDTSNIDVMVESFERALLDVVRA